MGIRGRGRGRGGRGGMGRGGPSKPQPPTALTVMGFKPEEKDAVVSHFSVSLYYYLLWIDSIAF